LYLHCLLVITDEYAVCRVSAAFNSSLHALYAGGYLQATLREKKIGVSPTRYTAKP
jgi:hypothetical protein